jgi:hypothetical protein
MTSSCPSRHPSFKRKTPSDSSRSPSFIPQTPFRSRRRGDFIPQTPSDSARMGSAGINSAKLAQKAAFWGSNIAKRPRVRWQRCRGHPASATPLSPGQTTPQSSNPPPEDGGPKPSHLPLTRLFVIRPSPAPTRAVSPPLQGFATALRDAGAPFVSAHHQVPSPGYDSAVWRRR